jgi:hypothetical protein
MCQGWLEQTSHECNRCGGGYTAGLDNWIPHQVWCKDDKEVERRLLLAEKKRQEYLMDCY